MLFSFVSRSDLCRSGRADRSRLYVYFRACGLSVRTKLRACAAVRQSWFTYTCGRVGIGAEEAMPTFEW